MSQFNSIFSPLSNKLARLAGITLLAVAALFASTQQMSAQVSCVQNLVVNLDGKCEKEITPAMVVVAAAADLAGLRVQINDNNASDDAAPNAKVNAISPASGWTYGVFNAANQLVCQGTIITVDKFRPVFTDSTLRAWKLIDTIVTWSDNLDDIYAKSGTWQTITNDFYTGRPFLVDSCEANGALTPAVGAASSTGKLRYFTGFRFSADGVANDLDSLGAWPSSISNIQIKTTDYLESPQCDSARFQYKIRRSFQLIDRRGNDTTLNQIIYFQRPSPRKNENNVLVRVTVPTKDSSFVGLVDTLLRAPGNLGQFGPFGASKKRGYIAYGSINYYTRYGFEKMTAAGTSGYDRSTYSGVTPGNGVDTLLFNLTNGTNCTAAPRTESELKDLLTAIYVAVDTLPSGKKDSISLFDDRVRTRMNYSVDFNYTEFNACNGGYKYQFITEVMDWCGGGIEKDTIIVKFEDLSAPSSKALSTNVSTQPKGSAETATKDAEGGINSPLEVSVNTNDCSASLRLPAYESLTAERATGWERDLGTLFNWTASDVCSGTKGRINYRIQTRDEYNDDYFINRTSFVDKNYTVASMPSPTGPVVLGLPVGEHRIIIEVWDNCSNQFQDTLWFNVIDLVAPVMKCDDQINVTLTSNSTSNYFLNATNNLSNKGVGNDAYARIYVSDINQGSRDNCTLDSMFVRRIVSASCITDYMSWNMDYDIYGNNDGKVDLTDFKEIKTGDNKGKYYTPMHMQYVEFYCCDGGAYDSGLSTTPMVELWGSDVKRLAGATPSSISTENPDPAGNLSRNWSYCWANVNIEDKTPPTINRPDLTKLYNKESKNWILCSDKEIIGDPTKQVGPRLITEYNTDTYDSKEGKIATSTWANSTFGTPDIFGIECNGRVTYEVQKRLTCDTGIMLRIWSVTKTIKTNPLTEITVRDTQIVWVQAQHDYTINVPSDRSTTCELGYGTDNNLTFDEDGCDLLAISKVEDKVYQAGATDNACKKVYRTWTVINWCQIPNQFLCANADPMSYARVIPRLKNANTPADLNGDAVAVQHRFLKEANNSTANSDRDKAAVGTNNFRNWVTAPFYTGVNWPTNAFSKGTQPSTRVGNQNTTTGSFADFALSNYNVLNPSLANCTVGEQTFAWQYTQVIKLTDNTAPRVVGTADGGPARRFTPVDESSDDVNWVLAWNPSKFETGVTYTESKRFTAPKEVFGIRGKMVTGDNGTTTSYGGAKSCLALVKFTFDVKDDCPKSGPFAVDKASVVLKRSTLQTASIGSAFEWNGGTTTTGANISISPVDFGSQTTPTSGTNPTTFAVTIDNIGIDLTTGFEDYQLLVTLRDDCGNQRVERIDFTVADVKAPAPVCVQTLKATLMPADASGNKGMVVIRAVDVFQDIYRNWAAEECTGTPKATIQLLDGVTGLPTGVRGETLTLTCDNSKGGVTARVYLQDAAGNQDYCVVTINVDDNNSICGATPPNSVAGAIQTESKATVEGVQVNLSGQSQKSFATGVNGLFVFNNLTAGADYTVTPSLNKGFLNGVSTFDLVLISKHILGVQPLNTPYKLIAADVNNSKSVTTLDLIQLRKLILNIDASFANNTSWRFVDASYTFPNASNPWAASFPEVKNVNDLEGSLSANFVAVKVGDVNGNAIANSTQGSVRNLTSNLGINVADMNLVAGNEYKVDFTAADLNGIEGFQFTLNLDKKGLELVDLVPGIAAEENFGIFAEEGVVTASWNGEAKGGVLFSLVVRAKSNTTLSEVLNLNSRYTAAEAYKGGEVVNVGLNFNAAKASANYELYQNTPNPFAGESIIGFNLPAAGAATLTIQDVTGRTLKVINGQYAKGYNQVSLKSTELSATGVLTYTLKAADFTATRKMIIVE